MEEYKLVEASRSGDRHAFGQLVDLNYKRIYRLAYQYTINHHDADDICQQTFLNAYRNITKLKKTASFSSWLYTICLNLLRKRNRQTKQSEELKSRLCYDHRHCCESSLKTELHNEVHKVIQRLPERLKVITILVLIQGLDQKHVAKIVKCSESTVSRYLDKSKAILAEKLKSFI